MYRTIREIPEQNPNQWVDSGRPLGYYQYVETRTTGRETGGGTMAMRLLIEALDGRNGMVILGGMVLGLVALVLGCAYAAERRPYRTTRQSIAEAAKTLAYAVTRR